MKQFKEKSLPMKNFLIKNHDYCPLEHNINRYLSKYVSKQIYIEKRELNFIVLPVINADKILPIGSETYPILPRKYCCQLEKKDSDHSNKWYLIEHFLVIE